MKELYRRYILPHIDIIAYIFWGVVTTVVNLITYHLCYNILHLEYYTSSIIAWVVAVVVAYLTNRKWVFHSEAKGAKEISAEIFKFIASRIASLVMEIILLYLGKDILKLDENLTKYTATILVVILNYILSKLFVFTITKSKTNSLKSLKKASPHSAHKPLNIKATNIFTKIIIGCGIFFFSLLTVATALCTAEISKKYLNDNIELFFQPIIILSVIAILVLLSLKCTKKLLSKVNIDKMARFVFLWGLITSIIWIFIANVLPMWDSADLISAANLLNGTPDQYSEIQWSDGWYMERYPYQVPMALLITLCMKIAGNNFIILFEIINCFACAFTMYLIVKLTDEIFHSQKATVLSGILVMFFIPIILYCTFIYGNIICLPFILAGFLYQKRSIDSTNNRKKVLLAITSAIFLVLGVYIKSSASIAIIATIVVWLFYAIREKRIQPLLFALLPIVLLKTFTSITNVVVSSKVGTDLNNGVPKITWITMGIGGGREYAADQENNPEIRNTLNTPGYFDAFAWITSKDEYSPELVSKISQEYLRKRLRHFYEDPIFALNFFGKKLLIEWTEPTFESFLASNWNSTAPDGYNMAERDYTVLAPSFYYGKAHRVLKCLMDTTQTLLAIGALTVLINKRKSLKCSQLTPIIFILGGAVLYLFWENKTQYMFPFYLLMIPYAGMGLNTLACAISKKWYNKNNEGH